jgi:DNA-binding NtrC family response regulator
VPEVLPKKAANYVTEHNNETILLVEDDPAILEMVKKMLEKMGYTVISAQAPNEAIQLIRDISDKVHLLISDVVMPEMNGRDLAKILQSACPELKVLFMSGYTANVIAHHGVLDDDINFIPKPFSSEALSAKVRAVLNDSHN